MKEEKVPRLLVDWDEPFANFRARPGGEPAAAGPVQREIRLLVEWGEPLLRFRSRAPAQATEPLPYRGDLRFLVDWSDDPTRARRREAAMATAILHLGLIILILLNPKIFPERKLSPAEAEAEARRSLTLLYLPSGQPQLPEAKKEVLTPEERKRMMVRAPLVLDRRQLELALPPPAPATPPAEAPSAPARGEAERGSAPAEKQIARLENIPRPERSGQSPLDLPLSSPGRTIEESLRRGQGQGGAGGAGGEAEGPIQPNFNTPLPTILSDTRGVDFSDYLARLLHDVRRNWYAVIPESARWGEQGKVVIIFTIQKDGAVPFGQPTLVRSSGRSHLDRPALAAIRASQPFPPLPAEFTGEHIVLQFTFLYNLPMTSEGP